MNDDGDACERETARAGVWTRYWSQQSPGSPQAGSFAGGYAGSAIEQWWRVCMGELSGRQCWLDVATGNGALPCIWSDVNSDPDARCAAVDIAEIHTPWLARIEADKARRIDWHSHTRAEALPFAAASVDVVMSQYGFEYAERRQAGEEIARVLAAGGALRLVMHHAAGRPAQLAQVELRHLDELCSENGFWTLACRLIEPFARSATPEGRALLAADAAAEASRQQFNAASDRLQDEARTSACPDVLHETFDAVAAILQRAVGQGAAAARSAAAGWSAHLQDSRLRLAELCAHALDESDTVAMSQLLAPWFCDIAIDRLTDRGHLMAWTLRATRRP